MKTHGKRYREKMEKVIADPVPLAEAVATVKDVASGTKFDQSVECVVNLGIDPRQADQIVRGSLSLPHGIGKAKRVIAFCQGDAVQQALDAGAVEAGLDELVTKVQGGWTDFDVAIATPDVMPKVGRLGRILGPQGKMPSPKTGTVTQDVATAVAEYAAGKIEFRNDAGGNVHAVVGKASFPAEHLVGNIEALVGHLKRLRPSGAKGTYIKKVVLSGSMSPPVLAAVS